MRHIFCEVSFNNFQFNPFVRIPRALDRRGSFNPYERSIDENDLWGAFGFDCQHIKNSSLVIVNAEEKLGVGTSQELVIAKYFKKPVITVLPKNSHHRLANIYWHGILVQDWIHPFIHACSDFIVETVDQIESIKDQIFVVKIKDISLIDEAVRYIESK